MSNTSTNPTLEQEGAVARFMRATEIDTRLLGMVGAMLVIWMIFDLYSRLFGTIGFDTDGLLFGGSFITPRNLWNLLNQTSSIAIMSTGMLLLIVMRQLDLSVGSMLSTIAVAIAVLQVYQLGPALGLEHPLIWILAVVAALVIGLAMGAFNGVLVAYAEIPAFIVTLGGLLSYGGLAFRMAKGETVAPMDTTFEILGGNNQYYATGPFWAWVLAVLACAGIGFGIINGRRQRQRFNFPLRPVWAEYFVGLLGGGVVLLVTYIVNSYPWPHNKIQQWAEAHKIAIPDGVENSDGNAICMTGDQVVHCATGLIFYTGYSIPFLIAIAVGFAMTFLATRTSFGRHIFATGGNPEAAQLSGINTKWLTVKVFMLMGFLVGISSIIVAARLNAAPTGLGKNNELYVIAAVVIGGTSLAGGVGTVFAAMLGALVMQSIDSGLTLLNFGSEVKDMVEGGVLVAAVWFDQVYRKRAK